MCYTCLFNPLQLIQSLRKGKGRRCINLHDTNSCRYEMLNSRFYSNKYEKTMQWYRKYKNIYYVLIQLVFKTVVFLVLFRNYLHAIGKQTRKLIVLLHLTTHHRNCSFCLSYAMSTGVYHALDMFLLPPNRGSSLNFMIVWHEFVDR